MRSALFVATLSRTVRAFLLPYGRHLRANGWEVDVLASGAAAEPACREAFDRCWTCGWGRNPLLAGGGGGATLRRIRRIVADRRYDLVHVHTPVAAFLTRLALRRTRGPAVVYTAHGFHFHPLGGRLRNRIFLMLERLAGRWTDALIVLNQEDYEAAREQGIVPADRLFRMPGIGLDLAYWARESVPPQAVADLRRELAVEEGARMLLCVAEMTARKRHADLLNGWARFVAASRGGNRLPPMLVLAGEGPLRRRLERQTARLGIGCWVRFVGFRDDLRPLYALADATLLISVQEGLPRSIMESLAMQTPVVASDIRGSHELVDASCGWLVPPRDPAGVADALRILAGLPEDARLQMGRNGRTKMQAFGLQRCLAETEDIYRQVLERRRA